MKSQLAEVSFAVSPEASASIHDTGVVILHASSGCIYSSNEIGASIWRGLKEQLATRVITQEISKQYGLQDEVAHDHVTRFVAELEQHELIERQGAL